MAPAFQGMRPARILAVNGTIDSEGLAFAEPTTYRVAVADPSGPLVFDQVVPFHRRPIIAPGKIIPARPASESYDGDLCIACIMGNDYQFIIFEGLSPGVCE